MTMFSLRVSLSLPGEQYKSIDEKGGANAVSYYSTWKPATPVIVVHIIFSTNFIVFSMIVYYLFSAYNYI